MKRVVLMAGVVLLALFAAELLYFHMVLTSPAPEGKAEAVIVFNGSVERIEPGHRAAATHEAKFLVFSPVQALTLKTYEKLYPKTGSEYITEDKARTTFENAYYANEIIADYHMGSVLLLTSAYHMPRSFLLLKLFLLGEGVKLDLLNAGGRGVDWNRW
jgi:uncharacterized SAM-binding protein YcdF (DUF218 family)